MSVSTSKTKNGPGRCHAGRYKHNQPGTKRLRRFVRDAKGEAISYRKDLLKLGVKRP